MRKRIEYMSPEELKADIKEAVQRLRHECNPITVGDVMAVLGYDLPSLSPFEALVFAGFAREVLEAHGFTSEAKRSS